MVGAISEVTSSKSSLMSVKYWSHRDGEESKRRRGWGYGNDQTGSTAVRVRERESGRVGGGDGGSERVE